MSEISKAYEPQSVEDKWYQFWLDGKFFVANEHSAKPAYSIVIPPPNVTGVLTLGHVLNNTIQDILCRKARMEGKEVLWLPGTDHAGIATQVQVERALKKEGKIKHRDDLGREKFLEEVWKWKNEKGGIIIQQLKKLGASCDWTRERFTMDPEYSRCVQRVFVDLYKKGLIYRGKRMVNWCPASLTALSDEEVVMKEQKSFLYYFKVEVAEIPGTFLTIATTRPETIPGDTAVAVNPKDPRYAHLIGKHVVRPLPAELPREQKLIPIIGDEHVDFEFGTGVLKVTPAHDKADFEIGLWHKLAAIEVIAANGQMNDAAGADLRGLDRFKARKVAVEKLTELGALEKEEPYTNNVGFSERADVPIEPRLSEQWFLKYPGVEASKSCVAHEGYKSAVNLSQKTVRIVSATGKEISGKSIHDLRKAALAYARKHRIIGVSFKNEDSGIEIRVGRQSLSHAFSHLGVANILAVAVLPELIRSAVWISSEPHEPHNPMVKLVHRFIAALSLAGELHSVLITAKEFYDGTVLYDHRTKKITFGGKSLEAHLPKEKLDTQPAPNACINVNNLLSSVNVGKMQFHPQRWAKVYDHWMGGLQDWCVSRQLWWGHRIPVWTKHFANEKEYWGEPESLQDELSDFLQMLNDSVPSHHGFPCVKFLWDQQLEKGLQEYRPDKDGDGFTIFIGIEPSFSAAHDYPLVEKIEKAGFTQDPDVLDTWFSSWLWPFATMGWPEQTDTLKKFYPTTDLVTGPDIIFFWVARMIMAGYEYMDELPFQNVYFTGIIRDKQGRKMSKSLGNSPDPLDLIAKFGADALRFGVMRAAPLGQDILFDEQNVELGRNFCNKLWNACRFRQMVGSADLPIQGEIDPKFLTSDDKWILLKLDTAIREVTIALNEYKFSDATATLYRFFWSEYCDWYVEASKAVLGSARVPRADSGVSPESSEASGATPDAATGMVALPENFSARKANTLAVIDFVLSHTIRLFHPFLPFITEELWHGMGYSTDMPDNQGGKTIMFAPWPKPLNDDFKVHYSLAASHLKTVDLKDECKLDEQIERDMFGRQKLVIEIRNIRSQNGIASNKKLKLVYHGSADINPHEKEILKLLVGADCIEHKFDYHPAKGEPVVYPSFGGKIFIPREGLIDVAAEKTRLTKELEKIESEISKVEQKLANPNFAQKVPANVLEEHKQRLVEWQNKLAHTKAALDAMRG
ncbi:MAG TPA: class I tRNA ligase family protein [Methylomirabilota bacterium]|nr:class I tRNA ligase family protein [Methylomirabilota bacterium]